MSILTQKRTSIFLKDRPNRVSLEHTYYKEIALLAGAGGWNIDFINNETHIDKTTKLLLGLSQDFQPTFKSIIKCFVEGDHREKATQTFFACKHGTPFEVVLKMQTEEKAPFWVKTIGKPRYNSTKQIIGIHGVFIDIDKDKKREQELENSNKIIKHQNKRLRNFSHIVSHNLRSHTSNLQLSLELFNTPNTLSLKEKKELMDGLSHISANLNETISHLNDLVKINNTNLDTKKSIRFQEIYDRVRHTLSNTILETKADIFVDFTELPEIDYISSYLESILQNLLSNALKYSHPDRSPTIQICTYVDKNNNGCLLIKDNGKGIDLNTFGDRIFNLYQTFHNNTNATGVGLYMTRNQVEALGGTIGVESEPDRYTTFTIRF